MSKSKYFKEITLNHNYFKTQAHFINYCNKAILDNNIQHPFCLKKQNIKILAWCLANRYIFRRNGIEIPIDKFTYALKFPDSSNVFDELLKTEKELIKLREGKIDIGKCKNLKLLFGDLEEESAFKINSGLQNYTTEFLNVLLQVGDKFGLYFLYDLQSKLIYIGKSISLDDRVVNSMQAKHAFYCQFIITDNECDANILEPYYIAKEKPELNVQFKTLDFPTFEINHKYVKTDIVKIFNINYENYGKRK